MTCTACQTSCAPHELIGGRCHRCTAALVGASADPRLAQLCGAVDQMLADVRDLNARLRAEACKTAQYRKELLG